MGGSRPPPPPGYWIICTGSRGVERQLDHLVCMARVACRRGSTLSASCGTFKCRVVFIVGEAAFWPFSAILQFFSPIFAHHNERKWAKMFEIGRKLPILANCAKIGKGFSPKRQNDHNCTTDVPSSTNWLKLPSHYRKSGNGHPKLAFCSPILALFSTIGFCTPDYALAVQN